MVLEFRIVQNRKMQLKVLSATHIKGHILDIKFNDNHHERVDFSTFILTSTHPDYEKYRTVDSFLNFKIIDGNLNWDDYTMIFPVEDLYHNTIINEV